jgi:hypothetical protein
LNLRNKERRVPAKPNDYAERLYAGVLGKLTGVYLVRPFEGWTYERIMRELGPIHGDDGRAGKPQMAEREAA